MMNFLSSRLPLEAPDMTHQEKVEKRNWFLFMIGYFTAGYLTINVISSHRSDYYNVATAFDRAVPFVPAAIFGYILVYLSILLVYLIIKDMRDWNRAVISFIFATTLAYAIFLLFPVRMDMRPDLSGLTGISAEVTKFYYIIDMPFNCFPSLHVTYPMLATIIAWRNHTTMRWVFAAMTIVVAVSVVMVKQHYLADVVAGFANGSLCYWLTVKFESRWVPWFTPTTQQASY